MPPFSYPKSNHIRRQSPPAWKTYSLYKLTLRQEFEKQCVYCRLPDTLKGQDNFGVDHYKPKRDFPNLIAEYSNLFYACNCCNRRKGTFWPDSDQLAAGLFIPNPCEHIMFEHLRYRGVEVIEHSETGKFAKDILDLNDDASVEYRQIVLDIMRSVKDRQLSVEQTINQIENRIESSTDSTEIRSLRRKKNISEQEVNRLKKLHEELSGESES
jgi:hypothetical protein